MTESKGPIVVAAGDYHAAGFDYIVWLRPGRPNWPAGCSCCLVPGPDNRVETFQGRTFIYPLCAACRRHCIVDEFGTGIAMVVGLVLPAAAYYSVFGLAYLRGSLYVMGVLYLMAALAAGWVVHRLITRSLCSKGETCADDGWPVTEFNLKTLEDTMELMGDNLVNQSQRDLRINGSSIAQAVGSGLVALSLTNAKFVGEFIAANGGDPAWLARQR